MKNKLRKDQKNSLFFGVCAGLSDYLKVDVIIVRLFFACGFIFIGELLFVYLVLALVMPSENYE